MMEYVRHADAVADREFTAGHVMEPIVTLGEQNANSCLGLLMPTPQRCILVSARQDLMSSAINYLLR